MNQILYATQSHSMDAQYDTVNFVDFACCFLVPSLLGGCVSIEMPRIDRRPCIIATRRRAKNIQTLAEPFNRRVVENSVKYSAI